VGARFFSVRRGEIFAGISCFSGLRIPLCGNRQAFFWSSILFRQYYCWRNGLSNIFSAFKQALKIRSRIVKIGSPKRARFGIV
jgi:hypothetical protein